MRSRAAIAPLLGLSAVLALTIPVLACMWDYDTLAMERERFPEVLELITGKFLRHTPEFYQWRVADRLEKLKKEPERLEWYDDLAVAYEKLDQHDKAIETILQKDKIKPGLYETEANLSVFLVHSGKWEEGLAHVKKALEINPDAHFGREKYQQWLVEYAMLHIKDGQLELPMAGKDERGDFYHHLREKFSNNPGSNAAELNAAVKGVSGMMRFANYKSPLLLEALASFLYSPGYHHADGKMLAARCFLKAAYETQGAVSAAYRTKALDALYMQVVEGEDSDNLFKLKRIEADFKQELAEADAWYAELRKDELAWIKEGGDVEARFAAKYYKMSPEALKITTAAMASSLSGAEAVAPLNQAISPSTSGGRFRRALPIIAMIGVSLALSLMLIMLLRRHARKAAKLATAGRR